MSDKELQKVLIKFRRNADAELGIIVKELQYARFLLKHVIEFEADENALLNVQKLIRNYVNANIIINNRDL